MYAAADFIAKNYWIGGCKPVIDDELAYEGAGDGWREADVIEAHLGAFLGGGYGTTGYKSASKKGHYFYGNFKASEHLSADNLKWLREKIDENITFYLMQPVFLSYVNQIQTAIFSNIKDTFRVLEWQGRVYVLGTNQIHQGIEAKLPDGKWQVKCFDVIQKEEKLLSTSASGIFIFDAPDSRSVLFHFKKVE